MRRAAHRKHESVLINFYFGKDLLPHFKEAVRKLDTDRSKFIRAAIREKMARHGLILDN